MHCIAPLALLCCFPHSVLRSTNLVAAFFLLRFKLYAHINIQLFTIREMTVLHLRCNVQVKISLCFYFVISFISIGDFTQQYILLLMMFCALLPIRYDDDDEDDENSNANQTCKITMYFFVCIAGYFNIVDEEKKRNNHENQRQQYEKNGIK